MSVGSEELRSELEAYRSCLQDLLNDSQERTLPVHVTEIQHHKKTIELLDELIDHMEMGPLIVGVK